MNRSSWTKKARAVVEVTPDGFNCHLFGPSDGSGCRPAGESITHIARTVLTIEQAVADAKAFCDSKQIRITGWNVPARFTEEPVEKPIDKLVGSFVNARTLEATHA